MDQNNAVEDFLKDVKGDSNEELFNQELVPPIVEKKEVEEVVPFHKDPKVTKFIEKEVDKKIKDRLADIGPSATESFEKETKEQSDELSEVLVRIIGNDTPEKLSAIKDFKKVFNGMEERGAQRALAQLQEKEQESRQAEQDAQNELSEGFSNIEETFKVDLTSEESKDERSRFVDFIKLVAPKDEDGQVAEYPDLTETYRAFKQINKPESNNRAKELAARSMTRSSDTTVSPASGDKSWNSVDRFFNSLSK